MVKKRSATIVWRLFLVGGVHNPVNEACVEARVNRRANPNWRLWIQPLRDGSALSGVQMHFPGPCFSLCSVNAMRVCCAPEQ